MNRQISLADAANGLGAEFAATAGDVDRSGEFPHQNFERLKEAGLLALTAPIEYGGRGATLSDVGPVIGAIAKGEPSTALILTMQYLNLASLPRGRWPRHVLEQVLRSAVDEGALINALRVEPELGTPVRGGIPATVATRTAEGWRLNGRKIYSTGSPGLSWGIVWGRTDGTEPLVGQFLVPMKSPGVTIEETWNQLGMRATASHDVVFDNVLLPAEYAVDIRPPAEWAGPAGDQAAWMVVLLGSLYDGVARAARDWIVKFARERKPSNLGAPIATVPRIQQAIGEIDEPLAVNARVLKSVARDTEEGDPPKGPEANVLKVALTENSIAVVEKALRLSGNHGISRTNSLERHLRNVLCARIHSPQEDSARIAAGRLALGV